MKFLRRGCDWNVIKNGLIYTVLFMARDRVIKIGKKRNPIEKNENKSEKSIFYKSNLGKSLKKMFN